MKTKVCAKCKKRRLAKFFGKNSKMTSGLSSYCISCIKISWKQTLEKDPERCIRWSRKQHLKRYGMTVDEYKKAYRALQKK